MARPYAGLMSAVLIPETTSTDVVDPQQIQACFDWALAGAPWRVLILPQGVGVPLELDADGFTDLLDRYASTAVLLKGGRLLDLPARFFVLPSPQGPLPDATALSWRRRLTDGLLRIAPGQLERAVVLKQRWSARRLGRRRHRWQALKRPAAAPIAQLGPPPSAFIVGLHWLALGGAEGFAFDCIRLAQATGKPVFVLCEYPSHTFYDPPEGVTVLPLYVLPDELRIDLIEAVVRAHPGALVHIHHCPTLYRALPRLRWGVAEPPRVIDSLHIDELEDGGFVRLSSVWGAYLDTTHVISRRLQGLIETRGGLHRDIRLGFLMQSSAPQSLPKPRLPQSLDRGRLHLCMVSRLVWQKRPFLTLTFVRRLLRAALRLGVEDLHFSLVGSGPLELAVQAMVRRDPLLRRFTTLTPATPQARELFCEADLLVQCSLNEGITLSSYEALARGCLVLSSSVGAQAELIAPPFLLGRDERQMLSAGLRQTMGLLSSRQQLERAIAEQSRFWSELARAPQALPLMSSLYG